MGNDEDVSISRGRLSPQQDEEFVVEKEISGKKEEKAANGDDKMEEKIEQADQGNGEGNDAEQDDTEEGDNKEEATDEKGKKNATSSSAAAEEEGKGGDDEDEDDFALPAGRNSLSTIDKEGEEEDEAEMELEGEDEGADAEEDGMELTEEDDEEEASAAGGRSRAVSGGASVASATSFASSHQEDAEEEQDEEQLEDFQPYVPVKVTPAKSAWMLYSMDMRVVIKAEQPELKMTDQIKAISERWKVLSDEEKQPYVDRAAEDKERYQQDKAEEAERKAKYVNVAAARQQKKGGPRQLDLEVALPLARVRKIMKLDPEVKTISKDATMLVSKATEMFIEMLGEEANKVAGRRKILKGEDVAAGMRRKPCMTFLRPDFPIDVAVKKPAVATRVPAIVKLAAADTKKRQKLAVAAAASHKMDVDGGRDVEEEMNTLGTSYNNKKSPGRRMRKGGGGSAAAGALASEKGSITSFFTKKSQRITIS